MKIHYPTFSTYRTNDLWRRAVLLHYDTRDRRALVKIKQVAGQWDGLMRDIHNLLLDRFTLISLLVLFCKQFERWIMDFVAGHSILKSWLRRAQLDDYEMRYPYVCNCYVHLPKPYHAWFKYEIKQYSMA